MESQTNLEGDPGNCSDESKDSTLKESSCEGLGSSPAAATGGLTSSHPLSPDVIVKLKPKIDDNSNIQNLKGSSQGDWRRNSTASEKSSTGTSTDHGGDSDQAEACSGSEKSSSSKRTKSPAGSRHSDSSKDLIGTPKPQSRSPSPALDIAEHLSLDGVLPQMTSTPLGTTRPSSHEGVLSAAPSLGQKADRPQSLFPPDTRRELDTSANAEDVDTSLLSQCSTHTASHESQTDLDLYDQVQVPIIGYETMEQRSRFTVFKIRVQKAKDEGWFIFRRYSDFVRLNDTLKGVFSHFRLALPPKKWVGDNYDPRFLEDRMLGLQAFLNNVVSHRDVCNSEAVRVFLCIDDPPGPHDSLEESRALCEIFEDQVYNLRQELTNRDSRISLLEEELALYKAEVENLRKALRVERTLNTHRRYSPSSHSQRSESSLTEQDQALEAEADQSVSQQSDKSSTSTIQSPEGAAGGSWDGTAEAVREGSTERRTKTAPSFPKVRATTLLGDLSNSSRVKDSPSQRHLVSKETIKITKERTDTSRTTVS